MKQIENARAVITVSVIESEDGSARMGNQCVVTRLKLIGCIVKIRQQGKEQIWVAVAKVADLQCFEQIIYFLGLPYQGGHYHHGAVACRDALRKIQSWQNMRWQEMCGEQIHQRDGHRRGGYYERNVHQPVPPVCRVQPA